MSEPEILSIEEKYTLAKEIRVRLRRLRISVGRELGVPHYTLITDKVIDVAIRIGKESEEAKRRE